MLQVNNLQKAFGKNEVLKGIHLDFDQPGITAVLGPNGSGKTTLIKCMLGMVIPDKGTVSINNRNILGEWAYRNYLDYLPQIARFPENLLVRELLEMIKDIRGRKANDAELIELFELTPFLDKRLGTLSGGTRQKVNLVQAFMYDNAIMMLDEPTTGLDPVAMIKLKDLIRHEKAKGKTILITTHIMSFVEEMADEIVFLLEGKVYFKGSVTEIKARHAGVNLEGAIANILTRKTGFSANGHTTEKEEMKWVTGNAFR